MRKIARKAGSDGFSMARMASAWVVVAMGVGWGGRQPPLVGRAGEIRRAMPGRNLSAGFLVLTNNTDTDIRITAATSPQFGAVEIHETTIEEGVSRMRELEVLLVPAAGSVTLERGGKHLMLMRGKDVGAFVALQLLSDGEPVLSIEYTYPEETG